MIQGGDFSEGRAKSYAFNNSNYRFLMYLIILLIVNIVLQYNVNIKWSTNRCWMNECCRARMYEKQNTKPFYFVFIYF